MCVLFASSLVCKSAYAYIIKSKFHCGSTVRFGRESADHLVTTQYLCFCCNWSANSVAPGITNQKLKTGGHLPNTPEGPLVAQYCDEQHGCVLRHKDVYHRRSFLIFLLVFQ